MMQNLFHISLLDWILMGALVLLFSYQFYFYIRYLAGVQRRVRHQTKGRFRWKRKAAQSADFHPGVSVVVCASNEEDNLQYYLQALLTQDYPEFEVIVVNDASVDNTQLVLEHYVRHFPNLRLTFVPTDAWVRSSKKLALTLAAKAARYDYLLLTDADCRPESPHWITEMMQGFADPNIEVVLGYAGYFEDHHRINRYIQYDTVFSAMQYLGMAMSRHPYTGDGRNLAYRKSTFFANRGFSDQLGQREGADGLFVHKVATRRNTEVVLTPGSFIWTAPAESFDEWCMQKYRRLSVWPSYRFLTRLRLMFEPLSRCLWYALLIAIAVLAILGITSSPLVWMLAALLFLVRLCWQLDMTSRAARIFGLTRFGLSLLAYDIFFPYLWLFIRIRHKIRYKKEHRFI